MAEAEAGRHTESIRLLEELSKNVPLPALYTNLGVEYAKVGNRGAAMKAFSSAINEDPSYEPAHLNRGIIAVSEGNPQEALSDLEKAPSIQQTKQVLEVARQELVKDSQENAKKPLPLCRPHPNQPDPDGSVSRKSSSYLIDREAKGQ